MRWMMLRYYFYTWMSAFKSWYSNRKASRDIKLGLIRDGYTRGPNVPYGDSWEKRL